MSRVSPGDSVRIANQAARVGAIAGGKYGTVAHVSRDTALVSVEGHGAQLTVDLADLEVMSGSRAPVDVLAVMDADAEAANDCRVFHDGMDERQAAVYAAESREARAAVAELVEADREYDAAKVAWDNAPGAAQGIGECDARDGSGPEFVCFMSATRRRAAALAKFGGAG